jgi:hypothetical protein
MLFGSMRFNCCWKYTVNSTVQPLYLTDFRIFNQSVRIKSKVLLYQSIGETGKLFWNIIIFISISFMA